MAFREKIARSIVVKIAGQCGLILKTPDNESKRRHPMHSTVYEVVLRYFEYDMTATPQSFSKTLSDRRQGEVVLIVTF